MEWKLVDIKQETNHPYLNFFTFIYEIKDGEQIKQYSYYVASRHSKDKLYALHHSNKPDGVLIPCYHIDENGKVSLLISSQFRPALNRVVTSIPAGLVDEGENLFDTAKREAMEEGGVIIDELELLAPASSTSSGLSDEINAIVLGKVVGFTESKKEEFEDIKTRLIPLNELVRMLDDDKYFFAMNVRLLVKYLSLRFSCK